jgi:sialate O-acetylesterase
MKSKSSLVRHFAFMLGRTLALCLLGVRVFAQAPTSTPETSQLKLPGVFCDHLVLQREKPIRIWGWAPPSETVTVDFSGQTKQTTTDSQGKWQVKRAPLLASSKGKTLSKYTS